MNCNIKRAIIAILATLTALCVITFATKGLGNMVLADEYTPAEFTATTSYDFEMVDGVFVKIANFNEGVDNAIRFTTKLRKTDLPQNNKIKVVTLITLTEYLDENELNGSKFTFLN